MSPETHLFRLRHRWTVLLIAGIALVGVVALLLSLSKTDLITEVANQATEEAARSPRIVERLGDSVEISGQPTGRLSSDRGVKSVSVVVPVAGSRGVGRLYATGQENDDGATLSSVAVVVGNERIDVPVTPANRDR